MPHSEQLACLQNLLENLPESIPYCDLSSTRYSFSITAEEVAKYGDETSAINHRLEIIFGSWHNTGGIVPVKERGPGICSVVAFLKNCSPVDARINLWIDNLCSSAEKLYIEVGKKVRISLVYHGTELTKNAAT